jgi:nitrite reductase/ring-hydroxylating ferredoxin subunit
LASRKGSNGKQTNEGFDQSWYALGQSEDFPAGQVVGRDFIGGRVAVFRDKAGKPAVLNAYCSHLGADLSNGSVIDGEVQCAFHHWQYGADGVCTRIPVTDKIPRQARVRSFPTAERWGLVWAFNGDTPLFDMAEFRGYDESQLMYRTTPLGELPVEPWVAFTNTVDFQHLRVLHGLKIESDPRDVRIENYTLEYDLQFEEPRMGRFDLKLRVVGTNTVAVTVGMSGMPVLSLTTATPMREGQSNGWLVTASPRLAGEDPAAVQQRIAIGEEFFKRLFEEDKPIMMNIKFNQGVMLPEDTTLSKFLKYVRTFPKAAPLTGRP